MESFEENSGPQEKIQSFEEQFSHIENCELFGGTIEYVDISPENLKTEVPVLFAPGWGETIETFKDSIKVMVSRGRRVIAMNHPRNSISFTKQSDKKYPDVELRKAFSLLKILEEKGIEKVDVMAHSEGGINTAIAATLETEKFRNIVFVNIGGLTGGDNFPKLDGRFNFNVIQEALLLIKNPEDLDRRTRIMRSAKEAASYIFQNPLLALKESIAISKAEIEDMLKDLNDKGIGIVVINGVDDPVFPMEKMQKIVTKDHLDGFLSAKGTHNEIVANPEKYVVAVDEMLDTLEANKSLREVA